MSVRAEGDDDEKAGGMEPDGKCGHCGMQNEMDAKFCDQCGKSMAAKKMDDGDDEPPPSSKAPESSKGAAASPPAERMTAPARMSADASLASILGAASESPLAIKTAAIELRRVRDTAAGVTGKSDPREIVGALLAVPEQIAKGQKAAADLEERTRAEDKRERWDLAHRLNKLNLDGRPRSSIFIDEEKDGKRTAVKLTREYRRMDLGDFRGLVEGFERNTPKKRATPFEPDRDAAKAAADKAGGKTFEQRVEAAKNNPTVRTWANRPGQQATLEQLAETYVRQGFDLQGATS